MSALKKKATKGKVENSYVIQKMFTSKAKYYPATNRKQVTLFLTATTTCGLLFLGASSLMLKSALTPELKPVERLLSEAYNIVDYSAKSDAPDASNLSLFSLFQNETEEPITYSIKYETDSNNIDDFVNEVNIFVEAARKTGATQVNLSATSFRYSFSYEGEIGEELNSERLNVALMMLKKFSSTSRIYSVEVESVTPEKGEKPLIQITTSHSLVSSSNIASHFPDLLDDAFTSNNWFNVYDFTMNVEVRTGDLINGTPLIITSNLSSLEDVEATRNIDINVYYNLYELTQMKWVTNPKEIRFINRNPFNESVLSIVVVSTDRDESFETQMYKYWMLGNPIFRPQPYLVDVRYNSADGALAFGLGR